MAVKMQYSAVAERTLRVGYRCSKCGTSAMAVVPVKAAGYATSPGLADNPEARQRAANQALQGTQKLANLTASLATCPRCGAKDEAAHAAFKKKITNVSIGGGVAFLLGLVLAAAAGSLGAGAGIFGGILLIGGATAALTGIFSYRSTVQKASALKFEAEPAR